MNTQSTDFNTDGQTEISAVLCDLFSFSLTPRVDGLFYIGQNCVRVIIDK